MNEELAELNIEDREEEDALLLPIDPGFQILAYEHCGVHISYLGVKRFLFKFFHEMDVERVVY
ncbi:hypothetical protein Goklo_016734 [Gossypium klotzschianum]|uniref:Uncharacterized protein n=1 Tax=Gossypium klotzschianum TaxID=34286 RepID=A0A7J8UFC4_9ROSI|nr:hypothetical protein [Gossypium klotzschianum]